MRGLMTANARRPKILGGSIAAVAASALLLILLHLAHSTHPVTAAAPPLQSSTWTTYIDSRQDNGDDEYGYEYSDSDFDEIDDRSFRFGGNTYYILYLKWEDSSDDVQFKLDDCLKPSELTSIKFQHGNTTRTFTRKTSRYSDSYCESRRSAQQRFYFDTSVNPLPADTRVRVTLTFNGSGGTNPTPTRTLVNTPTPVPTQPPSSTASLSPDPSTVNFRPDGRWRRFTVRSSGSIRVYVNPGSTPLNVEVNTSSSGNHCGNGAERESKVRSNGQSVYLAGCNAGTATVQLQTSSGTVIRTYTFSIGSVGGTNPTPVPTSTPSATASLSPDPSTVNIRAVRNQWHRFTVQSRTQVKIIANPTGSRRNVEINTSDPGRTYCAPEWSDTKTRSNGQYIYLEGCVSGTGTVELRQSSDNALLRTYTFSIGSSGGTNPTPVPTSTPVPTALDVNVGLKVILNKGKNISTPFANFRWQISDFADVALTDIPLNVSVRDYEYRIIAPQNTGIQVTMGASNPACNWSASGSSWPDEALWTDANGGWVRLVRCGLGNAATSLSVQMREKSDRSNIDYNSYSAVVKHPWHIRDNNVTYAFASDLVPDVSPTPVPSITNAYKEGVNQGADKWNNAGTGMSFTKVSLTASPDVVVQGYWSGGTNQCVNPNAVACVPYSLFTIYPHFNRQQRFYFEHEPVSGSTQYEWTNNYRSTVSEPTLLYMPIIMAHEFGHAAGLWHSPGTRDAMNRGVSTANRQNLSSNDKNAMKAIYNNHTVH